MSAGGHSKTNAGGQPLGRHIPMELLFLIWTEGYAVGHKGLDAEHRQLVEAINEICSAEYAEFSSDKLLSLLNALILLAVEHFKQENIVMHELSNSTDHFEAINEHCAHHAEALVALESIALAVGPRTGSAQQHLGQKLIDWFNEHAIRHDEELRVLFQSNFATS
jgi:hemerythrin-like metal-binding protein